MIQIYDTTLRDGTQREGISLSCDDKLRLARRLDELGVAFIEGGWPGSNPKDAEFFERAREMTWSTARIAAFGSTCRVGGQPEDDANIQALLAAGTTVCTVVGKTWALHVEAVLRTTRDENLRLIEQSLGCLHRQGRRVIYDAEHFFDGWRDDREYALETLRAAVRGGAETLVLCDTNGGSLPWQVAETLEAVRAALGHPLGVHCHDDTGTAVANSLAAVRAGAVQVQGTLNGYGERCGNANLCTVIPALELKLGRRCLPPGKLCTLHELSHFAAEVANLAPDEHLPYVGGSAFAHKGGIHVAAMRRSEESYQHVDPALVGNRMRVVVSELSGRGNLLAKAEEHGVSVGEGLDLGGVLEDIKALEAKGFSFEAAEASVAMMLKRQDTAHRPPFELIDFLVTVEHRSGRGLFAEAMVKVRVDGEVLHTAAEGDGPVDALDLALRKALGGHYPELAEMHLADYKVRILDGQNGTAATTRVLIDMQRDGRRWSTVGASSNIIEASWIALVDAIEYGLTVAAVKVRLVVLPGDGIGREVTAEAVRVLQAVARRGRHEFQFSERLMGGCSIDAHGTALTEEVLAECRAASAVLLGAVGGPKWDDPTARVRPEQGLLALRKGLGVFANLRPVAVHPSLVDASPVRPERVRGVDILVVRELTGGLYFGQPKGRETTDDGVVRAVDTMEYCDFEIRRVVKLAFRLASDRRKKVTSVDKANILESSRLWRQVATEVGLGHPEVALDHMLVDTAAMRLVTSPASFDVVVTENTFGDILTDEASVLAGSMGMLPSASIGDGGPGLYEPIHGSAPDIAGRGIANPLGAILSAAMCLRLSLGLPEEARWVETAVADALSAGCRTADLGGSLSTRAMADEVVGRL